jgi:hypothetical protein
MSSLTLFGRLCFQALAGLGMLATLPVMAGSANSTPAPVKSGLSAAPSAPAKTAPKTTPASKNDSPAKTKPPVEVANSSLKSINGQDVNGHAVLVNGTGHFTIVLYTNPDLEAEARKVTLALDSYRSRSDLAFVRVVDLRGGVPPEMRSIVRVQIREEEAKETVRLKKAGVAASSNQAPIIADFNGSTLDALGWDSVYDQVHMVVYDRKGNEIKRLENVSDAKQVTQMVDSIL